MTQVLLSHTQSINDVFNFVSFCDTTNFVVKNNHCFTKSIPLLLCRLRCIDKMIGRLPVPALNNQLLGCVVILYY